MKKEKRSKLYDVEAKWTFKTVATALLEGNTAAYVNDPGIWIADSIAMTRKMLVSADWFARDVKQEDA